MAPGDWYGTLEGHRAVWKDWDNFVGTELGEGTFTSGDDPANLNVSSYSFGIGGLLLVSIFILVVCKACCRRHTSSNDVTYVRDVSPDAHVSMGPPRHRWWTRRGGPLWSPQFVTVTNSTTRPHIPTVHSVRGYFQGQEGHTNYGQDTTTLDGPQHNNYREPSAPPPFEHPPTYNDAVGDGHHGNDGMSTKKF